MLHVYAPFLTSYWSQILALIVGFVIAKVLRHLSSDEGSATVATSFNENVVLPPLKNNNTLSGLGGPRSLSTHIDSSVEEQAKKERCEPDDAGDIQSNEEGAIDIDWEKWASGGKHIPYSLPRYTHHEMIKRSRDFYLEMNRRRSLRHFSTEQVPQEVIDNLIRTAGTSPSGAHTEPWTFVAVKNAGCKAKIREIIEAEEKINYEKRMGKTWLNDLKAVGTTWKKPYLEAAPYLIVVFKQTYGERDDGMRKTHYYHEISTSISVGILLAAIQSAGLVALSSTPMNAGPKLRALLERPMNEKVLLLLPVGFPADDATVPDFKRKPLEQILFVK